VPLLLKSGYEPLQGFPDWAKGSIEIQTIAATAGNVVTQKSPSANKVWKILYGVITLVTDATVANRYIEPIISNGDSVHYTEFLKSNAITASQTRNLMLNTGAVLTGAIAAANSFHVSLGDTLIINENMAFEIEIAGGQAGDSYSGYIVVQEIDKDDRS